MFVGVCHKTNEVDGGEDAKSWRHGCRSRDADGGMGVVWRLGPYCGQGGTGIRRHLGLSVSRGENDSFLKTNHRPGSRVPPKPRAFLSGGTRGGIAEVALMRSKVSKESSPSDGRTCIFLILPLWAFWCSRSVWGYFGHPAWSL